MTTKPVTLFVMVDERGQLDHINSEIDSYSLYASRAHATRVIRWLGLSHRKIRPATPDEISGGMFATAHCVPRYIDNRAKAESLCDLVSATFGVPIHGR